jgi:hypothetical protein
MVAPEVGVSDLDSGRRRRIVFCGGYRRSANIGFSQPPGNPIQGLPG